MDYVTKEFLSADQSPFVGEHPYEEARQSGVFVVPPAMEPDVGGLGAAGEVLAWAGRMRLKSQQPAAVVDPLLCRNCGTCLEVCGLGIPDLVLDQWGSHAWINPLLCQNCGTCVAHCPSGAIQPGTVTDLELVRTLERVLG